MGHSKPSKISRQTLFLSLFLLIQQAGLATSTRAAGKELVAPSFETQACALRYYGLSVDARQNLLRRVPKTALDQLPEYQKRMAGVVEDFLFADETRNGAFLAKILEQRGEDPAVIWENLRSQYPDANLDRLEKSPEGKSLAIDLITMIQKVQEQAPVHEMQLLEQDKKALRTFDKEYREWLKVRYADDKRILKQKLEEISRFTEGHYVAGTVLPCIALLGAGVAQSSVALMLGSVGVEVVGFLTALAIPSLGAKPKALRQCAPIDHEFYNQRLAPKIRHNLMQLQDQLLAGTLQIEKEAPHLLAQKSPGAVDAFQNQFKQKWIDERRIRLDRQATPQEIMNDQRSTADLIDQLLAKDQKFTDHSWIQEWVKGKTSVESWVNEYGVFEIVRDKVDPNADPAVIAEGLKRIRDSLRENVLSEPTRALAIRPEAPKALPQKALLVQKPAPLKKLSEVLDLGKIQADSPAIALSEGHSSRQAYRYGVELQSSSTVALSKAAEITFRAAALSGAISKYFGEVLPRMSSKKTWLSKLRQKGKAQALSPDEVLQASKQVQFLQDQLFELKNQIWGYESESKVLRQKLEEFSAYGHQNSNQGSDEFRGYLTQRTEELYESLKDLINQSILLQQMQSAVDLNMTQLGQVQRGLGRGQIQAGIEREGLLKLSSDALKSARDLQGITGKRF